MSWRLQGNASRAGWHCRTCVNDFVSPIRDVNVHGVIPVICSSCRVIVGVVVYFIVGAVIMKVRYQATGSELIPNKTFWMALPVLVKVSN